MISIGIVSEEKEIYGKCNDCKDKSGRKVIFKECPYNTQKSYYAISKDFNLKVAWKNESVRETVLRNIYLELLEKDYIEKGNNIPFGYYKDIPNPKNLEESIEKNYR